MVNAAFTRGSETLKKNHLTNEAACAKINDMQQLLTGESLNETPVLAECVSFSDSERAGFS